jgi:hypothetical protein
MATALPVAAGCSLKPEHYASLLAGPPGVGFFEVHAENFFCDGGPRHRWLTAFREMAPLSIHGVGLSLGGAADLDAAHLARLGQLLRRYQPQAFSEHLAWCNGPAGYLNDLLPLPWTRETLARTIAHVDEAQHALGVRMLVENPATYLRFATDEMGEADFLAELVARTGCGLLLDLNNVHVSAVNHGFDARGYLDALPLHAVGEIHLAGHARRVDAQGRVLLVDSHDAPVDAAVWSLYEHCLGLAGPLPTLLEWDANLPDWDGLSQETLKAQRLLDVALLARAAA